MSKLVVLLLFFSTSLFAAEARFWVWDLTVMPPGLRQPEFVLEREARLGEHDSLKIWVEKNLGAHQPTAAALDELLRLMAVSAPAGSLDPGVGIIELERRYFGEQPVSPSGDRDIHLVIAALPPYVSHGKKFGFDGFFNVFDQLSEAEARKHDQHSNERNIIYVNALQDISGDYMRAVVAHELNHLLTHDAENDPEPWLNEMLGEAAMQMSGYFTDINHVNAYRAHPAWPLAINGYGLSYGGLSLLAEYLFNAFGPRPVARLASERGDAFTRLAAVSGLAWNELFERYARWLFEQQPRSAFEGAPVSAQTPNPDKTVEVLKVSPSGVLYLAGRVAPEKLELTAAAQSCKDSRNVLRNGFVRRESPAVTATAVWVESTPPCLASRGMSAFDKDAFVIKWTNK